MRLILAFLLLTSIQGYAQDSNFPFWFSSERAKIQAIKEFISSMNIQPEVLYKLTRVSFSKDTYISGSITAEVSIYFETYSCKNNIFKVTWYPNSCSENYCTPFLIQSYPCRQNLLNGD
ncbi:MAG: hypothetical protein DRQ88_00810 [Epsilonproteobacteria bacterium]|nr:MAG: hypothetical protein DRQ89_10345 [Campylobacterota bacterium]RLA68175.1 MAG: hypothetical protein DRQ88_00810 [Campylobacterota bacterium]